MRNSSILTTFEGVTFSFAFSSLLIFSATLLGIPFESFFTAFKQSEYILSSEFSFLFLNVSLKVLKSHSVAGLSQKNLGYLFLGVKDALWTSEYIEI